MRGLSIPLPHYSSLRLPQICCVETLGRTLTHIQPSVLPRAPRQDLPVRSLALTSSDSIHTLQQQTEVWVLLHCEPAHMQNFSLNTREKKKSQFPMGTGRFFFISDWLLSPTNQVQNTRGNTESGGLHAFM